MHFSKPVKYYIWTFLNLPDLHLSTIPTSTRYCLHHFYMNLKIENLESFFQKNWNSGKKQKNHMTVPCSKHMIQNWKDFPCTLLSKK